MRKMLVCALGVALISGSAFAGLAAWEDLSTWGQSGATPAPFKDAVRSGYWWWPTEAASNVNDSELWGNRGVVYGMYTEPPPPVKPVDDKPPPVEPPKVERDTPVFNRVLFDFDKSLLKPEGKCECDKVVAGLKEFAKDTLVIEGHTCNVGEEDYNMGLGQRRADAVKKYLVESGIGEARIATKSLGETAPAVANDTPANRKLNRRVMFKATVVD